MAIGQPWLRRGTNTKAVSIWSRLQRFFENALTHRLVCEEGSKQCECPPEPVVEPPVEPELKDYTTENGHSCDLLDVLDYNIKYN
jgi:hypothetical protein